MGDPCAVHWPFSGALSCPRTRRERPTSAQAPLQLLATMQEPHDLSAARFFVNWWVRWFRILIRILASATLFLNTRAAE